MTFNIITPCFKEKETIIYRNIESVKNQSFSSMNYNHFVLFDGIDRDDLNKRNQKNLFFFKLRNNHDDYGDYARKIGSKISVLNKSVYFYYHFCGSVSRAVHLCGLCYFCPYLVSLANGYGLAFKLTVTRVANLCLSNMCTK